MEGGGGRCLSFRAPRLCPVLLLPTVISIDVGQDFIVVYGGNAFTVSSVLLLTLLVKLTTPIALISLTKLVSVASARLTVSLDTGRYCSRSYISIQSLKIREAASRYRDGGHFLKGAWVGVGVLVDSSMTSGTSPLFLSPSLLLLVLSSSLPFSPFLLLPVLSGAVPGAGVGVGVSLGGSFGP